MRRQPSQRSLPAILIVCIVVLAASTLLLVPVPTSVQKTLSTQSDQIPTNIALYMDGTYFSTPSSSLISPESFRPYEQKTTIFDSFVQSLSNKVQKFSPLDRNLVGQWVDSIDMQMSKPPISPTIEFKKITGEVVVSTGSAGLKVEQMQTVSALLEMNLLATSSTHVVTKRTGLELSENMITETKQFVERLIGKTLTLQSKLYSKTLTSKEVFSLLLPPSDLSPSAVASLSATLDKEIATPPIEPVLQIEGTTVVTFTAPKNGQKLDTPLFTTLLKQKIVELADSKSSLSLELPLVVSEPTQNLSSINTLGIEERIGVGESQYHHSIVNRVKNVSLTTSKIHAKLILPGEEFSFNTYLGEVSAKTGFLPAYVIKEGQTVLGDGGGVCQVSSTLFRAVLNTGLPITERRGHSYRVSYYEENSKPGFDATVYSPHPDFRFKNDTGAPILLNAVANPKTFSMYIELWGKSDGRIASIENYKQWGAQPAPPAFYQDDPTLAPGKIKQIDWAAPGLKTSFDYIVTYPNGEKKTKNFATNYIPWRAVYLRGI